MTEPRTVLQVLPALVAGGVERGGMLGQAGAVGGERQLLQAPADVAAELGLDAAAFGQAFDRLRGPDLAVDLDLSGTAGLPPAADLAVFRIVQEAINNAGRHARAGRIDVRIAAQPRLRITVADPKLETVSTPAGRFERFAQRGTSNGAVGAGCIRGFSSAA